jgi:hypothetical protein
MLASMMYLWATRNDLSLDGSLSQSHFLDALLVCIERMLYPGRNGLWWDDAAIHPGRARNAQGLKSVGSIEALRGRALAPRARWGPGL